MRSKSAALPYLGLAWTSALLAGCTLGGIRVKIESDLSGSIKLFKVSMKVAAEPRPDLVLGAKQEAASAILIEERDFRFERLSEVAIGEMRFEVREGEVEGAGDEARLVIRFPLSSEAGWFKSLEITDEEVIAARKAILERADEIPPFLQGIEEKLATIQLIVKLPWRVRESKVICSAPGAGSGFKSHPQKS